MIGKRFQNANFKAASDSPEYLDRRRELHCRPQSSRELMPKESL